jgi:hypothetical protein
MKNFKLPTAAEMAVVFLYLTAWLFPIAASWGVAVIGFRFSYVSPHWQNKNIDIVGMCILVALASGAFVAAVVLSCLKKKRSYLLLRALPLRLDVVQRIFLSIVLLIAAVGLFKSFGGTMFEKGYRGPAFAWLGYGAWSVTFLISLNLLVGDFLATRPFRPVIVVILSVIFLPFILSGSRIDFLSTMLALMASILILESQKFKNRVMAIVGVFFWSALVSVVIGMARYTVWDPALKFYEAPPEERDLLHLSTVGDLGASVFQVVGLEQAHGAIGLGSALLSYATRLLPGPFFSNRPSDFWLQLPELIGGGALHPLGEGYLISGLVGCGLVGAVFGVLVAVSIFASNHFGSTRSPILWIVFAFPWLLLIRGGWYQFFSILKSLEILALFLVLLVVIGWVECKVKKYDFCKAFFIRKLLVNNFRGRL